MTKAYKKKTTQAQHEEKTQIKENIVTLQLLEMIFQFGVVSVDELKPLYAEI
jgi:hypothetical protein